MKNSNSLFSLGTIKEKKSRYRVENKQNCDCQVVNIICGSPSGQLISQSL